MFRGEILLLDWFRLLSVHPPPRWWSFARVPESGVKEDNGRVGSGTTDKRWRRGDITGSAYVHRAGWALALVEGRMNSKANGK